MDINWLDLTVLVAITIALVNTIKQATGDRLGMWYTLISFGVGFIVYLIGLFAPDIVKVGLSIGLVASGIYVTAKTH